MAKFRKKPVVIEAVLWDGENREPVQVLARTAAEPSRHVQYHGGVLRISTLEGVMEATPGDWVIRGIKGELYPCKPDIFEATYEAVEG